MITGEELARFPVFAHLTVSQRAGVAEAGQECRYGDGDRLFREGEPASECWVIRDGPIALGTSVPARGQVVVQTLHEGDVVGWSWLAPPYRWSFTATAAGPVATIRFDARRLRALTRQDSTLCCGLLLGLFEGVLVELQGAQARLLDVYGSPRVQ